MIDTEGHEPTDQTNLEPAVAEAAYQSAAATLESVEEAAEQNHSPAVATALQDASSEAAVTVGRLDWLRRRLRKPRQRVA